MVQPPATVGCRPPPVTPKQAPTLGDRDWYPYYAAYSEAFASAILDDHLANAKTILDPWVGSGTTSAACHSRGISSVGLDINPAAVVIAKARLTPCPDRTATLPTADEVLRAAAETRAEVAANDPLAVWFCSSGVSRLRSVQRASHMLVSHPYDDGTLRSVYAAPDALPNPLCFLYCVLFLAVRSMLRGYATTNPMWFKVPKGVDKEEAGLTASWEELGEVYVESMRLLEGRLAAPPTHGSNTVVQVGNATQLSSPADSFDGVLTSPPYATRMDYTKGTLPELSTLGLEEGVLSDLRAQTTGTPVIRHRVRVESGVELHSPTAATLLESIGQHPSKGSQGYYYPWMKNYLLDLQTSIGELDRVVEPKATICMVVQNSHYKDVPIDLQQMVIDFFCAANRELIARTNFLAPNPRSPAATNDTAEASRSTVESLLVFH